MLTLGVPDGVARIAPTIIGCLGAGCLIVIVLGIADVYLTGHRLGPMDRKRPSCDPCCRRS